MSVPETVSVTVPVTETVPVSVPVSVSVSVSGSATVTVAGCFPLPGRLYGSLDGALRRPEVHRSAGWVCSSSPRGR